MGKPCASVANSSRYTEEALLEVFTPILSSDYDGSSSSFSYGLSVFPLNITASWNTNFWCVSNPSESC